MELGEFIKEVVTSIALTTSELQSQLNDLGCVLNPPADASNSETFVLGSSDYIHRRIINVEFDVAVNVKSLKEGTTGGSLKVLSVVEFGAEGGASLEKSQANRVKFSIPISLPESPEGQLNSEEMRRLQEKIRSQTFHRRKGVI